MILGIEIALLVFGIAALIRGKFSVGKEKTVTGWRARLLGLICLAPFPLAMTVGFVIGFVGAINGNPDPDLLLIGGIEFGVVIATCLVIVFLGKSLYAQQEREREEDELRAPASAAFAFDPGPYADPDNPYAPPRARS